MAQQEKLQQLLQQGIQSAKQGDAANARRLLEAVITLDENNELAWIWLASLMTTTRERRICLEKVLNINPNNQRAREALNALVSVVGERREFDATEVQLGASPTAGAAVSLGGERRPLNLQNPLVRIGIILGVVFMIFVMPSILMPPPVQVTIAPFPTFTPILATNTPVATATLARIVVTRDTSVAVLPPTFTPTATPTETDTPTPTITPFPLSAFTLFVSARGEGQPSAGLYRYLGNGKNEAGLAENIRDMSFDLAGQQLVFVRDVTYPAEGDLPESTVSEVFVAPINDLSAAQQITTLRTSSARSPIFNPNGREIIFVSNYDGDDELWLIDPTTQITRQITNNETQDRDPAWSPDGSLILFAADRNSPAYFDLYALEWTNFTSDPAVPNESGYPLRLVLDESGSSSDPAWSLDGNFITFVNDQEGDPDIYIAEADGERVRLLNGDEGAEDRAPSWSPDGRSVIWISNGEDDRFQVYVYTIAERQLTRLITDTRNADSAVYQPDIQFRLPN